MHLPLLKNLIPDLSALRGKIAMDPVTAIANVLVSINTIVNTLLSKASTPEIDALIASHIASRQKFEDWLAKFIH